MHTPTREHTVCPNRHTTDISIRTDAFNTHESTNVNMRMHTHMLARRHARAHAHTCTHARKYRHICRIHTSNVQVFLYEFARMQLLIQEHMLASVCASASACCLQLWLCLSLCLPLYACAYACLYTHMRVRVCLCSGAQACTDVWGTLAHWHTVFNSVPLCRPLKQGLHFGSGQKCLFDTKQVLFDRPQRCCGRTLLQTISLCLSLVAISFPNTTECCSAYGAS